MSTAKQTRKTRGLLDDARKLGAIGLIAPSVVFVVSAWAKAHFGPMNAVCNTVLGQFAQAADSHASLNCGVDTLIFEIARVGFWGSLAVGLLALLVLVVGLIWGPDVFDRIDPPDRSSALELEMLHQAASRSSSTRETSAATSPVVTVRGTELRIGQPERE